MFFFRSGGVLAFRSGADEDRRRVTELGFEPTPDLSRQREIARKDLYRVQQLGFEPGPDLF